MTFKNTNNNTEETEVEIIAVHKTPYGEMTTIKTNNVDISKFKKAAWAPIYVHEENPPDEHIFPCSEKYNKKSQ